MDGEGVEQRASGVRRHSRRVVAQSHTLTGWLDFELHSKTPGECESGDGACWFPRQEEFYEQGS